MILARPLSRSEMAALGATAPLAADPKEVQGGGTPPASEQTASGGIAQLNGPKGPFDVTGHQTCQTGSHQTCQTGSETPPEMAHLLNEEPFPDEDSFLRYCAQKGFRAMRITGPRRKDVERFAGLSSVKVRVRFEGELAIILLKLPPKRRARAVAMWLAGERLGIDLARMSSDDLRRELYRANSNLNQALKMAHDTGFSDELAERAEDVIALLESLQQERAL